MSVARFSTLLLCASLALSGCNPQTPPGVTPTPGPSVIPSEPPALREVNGPWNQTKLPLTERQQRVMGNLLSATLTMTAFERRGNSDLLLLIAGSDASAGPNALDAAREGQRGASISPGSFKQQFKQVANSDGTTTATITRSVYSFPYYYGETIAYTPALNIWHVPSTFTHRQDYGTDQVGSARTTERVTSSMPYGGGTSVYLLPEHHEVMTDPKQRPTIRFELKEGTEATGTITFASGFKGTFSRSHQDERGFIVEGENLKLVGRYDDKDQPAADVFLDGAKIGTVPLQYPSMLPPATPSPSPGP